MRNGNEGKILLTTFKYNLLGRGRFVEQKLTVNLKCDQIRNNPCYEFSHTVLLLHSGLDVKQTNHWAKGGGLCRLCGHQIESI